MSDAWAVLLAGVVGGVLSIVATLVAQRYASRREAAAASAAREDLRKESEISALEDLQVALVAWYEPMIDIERNPDDPPPPTSDRFPELRILMLTERVHDDELRAAIDDFLLAIAEVLIDADPALNREQRKEQLASLMSLYPGVQRRIGGEAAAAEGVAGSRLYCVTGALRAARSPVLSWLV